MEQILVELGKGIRPTDPDSNRVEQVTALLGKTLDTLGAINPLYRNMVERMRARISRETDYLLFIPCKRHLAIDISIVFWPPLAFRPNDYLDLTRRIELLVKWRGGRHNTLSIYRLEYDENKKSRWGPLLKTFQLRSKDLDTIAAVLVGAINTGISDRVQLLEDIIKGLREIQLAIGPIPVIEF